MITRVDHRVRRSERAAAAALAGAAAVVVLVPEVVGLDGVAPWPIVVAFRRRLAVATAIAATGAALRPGVSRAGGLGAGAVAAAALAISGARHRPRPAGPPDERVHDAARLSVLGANVWLGQADPVRLAAVIRRERPDVVVLPEAGDPFRARLGRALADLAALDAPSGHDGYRSWSCAPGRVAAEAAGFPDHPCTTVLTAARLGDVTVRPATTDTRAGWVEVTGGGLGDVRVLGVHPAVLLPDRTPDWRREFRLLAAVVGRHGGPTVVVGDLNATLEHRPVHRLPGLRSAAAAGGPARVGTWPARRPRWLGVAIDHVLVSDEVVVVSFRVLDVPGSDHRAVLARLRVTGRTGPPARRR